jgi:Na+/H+ antiporter NhaD/arsenite permease-like protein
VLLVAIFVIGYVLIAFEEKLKLDKSASALLTGVLCWTAYILKGDPQRIVPELEHHLGALSQILFFLLGAMTIVELVDAYDGFQLITSRVRTKNRRALLVTIAVLAFFLSAVLDNLTTSIVMMSLVRRLVNEREDRMVYGGVVILAANAGGAWSPIGDVTTTMLWVSDRITTLGVLRTVFIPALVSIVVPMIWLGWKMKGDVQHAAAGPKPAFEVSEALGVSGLTSLPLSAGAAAIGRTLGELGLRAKTGVSVVMIERDGASVMASALEPLREGDVLELSGTTEDITAAVDFLFTGQAPMPTTPEERRLVLITGFGVLLFVPIFKTLTHLPPVMGVLLGLGVLWTLTEVLDRRRATRRGTEALSVAAALQRVDSRSVLFFLGILLAISALESNGTLESLAHAMDRALGDPHLVTITIGVVSSVVDNVPLVAAAQGMYSKATYPTDHTFWTFLAYCAGTGGSILIIGSAAGVAVMGIQRVTFGWYVRRLSLPALLGYAAGALAYLALSGHGAK